MAPTFEEQGYVWNGRRGQWELTPEAAAANAAKTEAARLASAANPFDPRSEVSADAYYIAERVSGRIVKHLWIIFVLLPVVLGILFALLK